jgi:hypothetical protein
MRRSAFTLIELLIVIVIIMVLAGLLLVASQQAIFHAKAVKTIRRMDHITESLIRCGIESGSSAAIIQEKAQLGGVLTFRRKVGAMTAQAEPANGTWQDISQPHRFGFPWNRENLNHSDESDASAVTVDGRSITVSSVTLTDLSPLETLRLLALADVLPADDATTSGIDESEVAWADRSPERGWNDAWGNPLAVSWGLFQPGLLGSAAPTWPLEKQIEDSIQQYHYSRALYISVAAMGPSSLSLSGSPIADLPTIWGLATRVCQPTPESTWTERSFADAPWNGVKREKGTGTDKGQIGFLSTPHEIR